jgi:hypothetical protein
MRARASHSGYDLKRPCPVAQTGLFGLGRPTASVLHSSRLGGPSWPNTRALNRMTAFLCSHAATAGGFVRVVLAARAAPLLQPVGAEHRGAGQSVPVSALAAVAHPSPMRAWAWARDSITKTGISARVVASTTGSKRCTTRPDSSCRHIRLSSTTAGRTAVTPCGQKQDAWLALYDEREMAEVLIGLRHSSLAALRQRARSRPRPASAYVAAPALRPRLAQLPPAPADAAAVGAGTGCR